MSSQPSPGHTWLCDREPKTVSILGPIRHSDLLSQVPSASSLFSLTPDNPILLVGNLAGMIRKVLIESPLLWPQKGHSCHVPHEPLGIADEDTGFQRRRKKSKIPMLNTIHLTSVCFRTWCEKNSQRNPGYSERSPLIPRKQITGKRRGLLRREGLFSCPAFFLHHCTFHT